MSWVGITWKYVAGNQKAPPLVVQSLGTSKVWDAMPLSDESWKVCLRSRIVPAARGPACDAGVASAGVPLPSAWSETV